MAESCIFCGKNLTLFGGHWSMLCGDVKQPVCGGCYESHLALPPLERARLALETGRAREPERIRAFLEEEPKRLQAEEENRNRRRERQRPVLTCCGQEMNRLEEYELRGKQEIFETFLPAMVVFRCELCGQIKFFDASFFEEEPPKAEEERVTCPVCGNRHSPKIGCPFCAVREAQAGRMPQTAKAPRSGEKPPWEK